MSNCNDYYPRDLDELLVSDDADVLDLIEARLHLFYSKTALTPTHITISPDVQRKIVKEFSAIVRHGYVPPSANRGFTSLRYMSAYGEMEFQMTSAKHKRLMIIGIKNTYADYNHHHVMPQECWSEYSRRAIDAAFEDALLSTEEEECLRQLET